MRKHMLEMGLEAIAKEFGQAVLLQLTSDDAIDEADSALSGPGLGGLSANVFCFLAFVPVSLSVCVCVCVCVCACVFTGVPRGQNNSWTDVERALQAFRPA